MKRILDIGCGPKKYKSSDPEDVIIGLDIQKFGCVDVIWNLQNLPLPFKNEEFDIVHSSHVLEHVNNLEDLIEDIYRILKPEGIFEVKVPHHMNPAAYECEHRTYWSTHSLDCLEVDAGSISASKGKFKVLKKEVKLIRPFRFLEPFVNRFSNFYEWRLCHVLPAREIHFILRKVAEK